MQLSKIGGRQQQEAVARLLFAGESHVAHVGALARGPTTLCSLSSVPSARLLPAFCPSDLDCDVLQLIIPHLSRRDIGALRSASRDLCRIVSLATISLAVQLPAVPPCFPHLRHLQHLHVVGQPFVGIIDISQLAQMLSRQLPALTTLCLTNVHPFDTSDLERILLACPRLTAFRWATDTLRTTLLPGGGTRVHRLTTEHCSFSGSPHTPAALPFLNMCMSGAVCDISCLKHIHVLQSIKHINLSHTGVQCLGVLAEAKQLQVVKANSTRIDSSALLALRASLPSIQSLDISDTDVDDCSILEPASSMTCLNISGTRVSSLSFLASWSQLRRLYMHDVGVEDLSCLRNASSLRSLKLRNPCWRAAVCSLLDLQGARHLDTLELSFGPTRPLLIGLQGLATSLSALTLHNAVIAGARAPFSALGSLQHLHLSNCGTLQDLGLGSLPLTVTKLALCSMAAGSASSASLACLGRLRNLAELTLFNLPGVMQLPPFDRMDALTCLELTRMPAITTASVAPADDARMWLLEMLNIVQCPQVSAIWVAKLLRRCPRLCHLQAHNTVDNTSSALLRDHVDKLYSGRLVRFGIDPMPLALAPLGF